MRSVYIFCTKDRLELQTVGVFISHSSIDPSNRIAIRLFTFGHICLVVRSHTGLTYIQLRGYVCIRELHFTGKNSARTLQESGKFSPRDFF